ncbi:MFS transporter [Sulfurifustis variabilis]|uniref:MFS transporter n=1 Tax=Sulfurifustis variabilis TaxID=1675686 RepID=A0A1B4V0C0_9GAMM|nr:MFS transporter [Sulfurifustis variabilis]BAU46889.1 MFS transporter [Sulfurifustis variabilis]
MTRSARLAQGFSNVGHSYAHIMMLLYPTVVIALEAELRMSYGELLMLMLPGNLLFGAAALPAGWLGDRWSTQGMMVTFFVGMGAAAVLTGFMSTASGLLVGLTLIGLFAAIYHPVGMSWLVRNAENRGKALGFNGVFGSLGLASAALIAGVLTDAIHWRAAFIVPGVVSIATGLALLFFIRSGLVHDRHPEAKPKTAPPHRGAMVRAFVVLSVTMLCTGLVYQSMSTAFPKVLAERLPDLTGGTAAGAGVMVSIVYFLAMGLQLLGGHLADRHSMRNVYILTYALQVPLLALAAYVSGLPLYFALMATALLGTVTIPVENSLLSHYSPAKWRGTAFGAKFVLALGVSALGVPIVAGIHAATGEFYWYFVLLASLAIVVVVAGWLLPQDKPARVTGPAVTVDRAT